MVFEVFDNSLVHEVSAVHEYVVHDSVANSITNSSSMSKARSCTRSYNHSNSFNKGLITIVFHCFWRGF
jgi:hypothetical protein